MDFFKSNATFGYTPYKKLKGNKAREDRKAKRLELVNKAKEGFMDFGRKIGATNLTEKIGDVGATLANKAFNLVGYEEGGVVDGYKKGGKVKRVRKKKVIKQKQNVKQVVNVKIGGENVKRRREYKPRQSKAAPKAQPIINVSVPQSYQPTQQDQSIYEALRSQVEELKKAQQPVQEEVKPIERVRQRQQKQYSKGINKPEEVMEGMELPLEPFKSKPIKSEKRRTYEEAIKKQGEIIRKQLATPVTEPTIYGGAMAEQPRGRGRPKSQEPLEERKKKYAEKAKQKRQEKKQSQVSTEPVVSPPVATPAEPSVPSAKKKKQVIIMEGGDY
jgi:hypothetical protein